MTVSVNKNRMYSTNRDYFILLIMNFEKKFKSQPVINDCQNNRILQTETKLSSTLPIFIYHNLEKSMSKLPRM